MHAGFHFVKCLSGATQHEVVSVYYAAHAQAGVVEAARARAALGEAELNELLG